jgi:predicted ATPase
VARAEFSIRAVVAASCIGHRFDLKTLAIVAGFDAKATARGLWQV